MFPGFLIIAVQRFIWPSRLESAAYTGCCRISLLICKKLLFNKVGDCWLILLLSHAVMVFMGVAFLSLRRWTFKAPPDFPFGPSGMRRAPGRGLVRESTPGMWCPWSAGVAACSSETWRGQGKCITKTVLPCFTLTLLVHAMCTRSFSDYDKKNVKSLCCIATVTEATKPYAPVFQEMINKVTPFLSHLLHWHAEETVNSPSCCCRPTCLFINAALWSCGSTHSFDGLSISCSFWPVFELCWASVQPFAYLGIFFPFPLCHTLKHEAAFSPFSFCVLHQKCHNASTVTVLKQSYLHILFNMNAVPSLCMLKFKYDVTSACP